MLYGRYKLSEKNFDDLTAEIKKLKEFRKELIILLYQGENLGSLNLTEEQLEGKKLTEEQLEEIKNIKEEARKDADELKEIEEEEEDDKAKPRKRKAWYRFLY